MMLAWASSAWADYLYWQQTDKQTLKRINMLINDVNVSHLQGLAILSHYAITGRAIGLGA